jgi:hypothetical protein
MRQSECVSAKFSEALQPVSVNLAAPSAQKKFLRGDPFAVNVKCSADVAIAEANLVGKGTDEVGLQVRHQIVCIFSIDRECKLDISIRKVLYCDDSRSTRRRSINVCAKIDREFGQEKVESVSMITDKKIELI